ncbi:MAG: NTP transferase domain-containing protein [Candidatus Cloacimonetes bacterium]|nr:NTP transferase domain-containing protein [Candidatus Cloacimonadota bacterium]
MPCSEIIAVILASGQGRRFGGPKVDARAGSQTFAEHIVATLKQAGIDRIHIARDLQTPDMLATLKVALSEARDPQTKACLVFPVDHPFVKPDTVRSLCSAWQKMPEAVFRPVCQGRPGHPVLIPLWLDLDADDQGRGLAGIIRSQACSVIDIPVEDGAILRNVNFPKDLREE